MHNDEGEGDYKKFMNWFQNTYPDLYTEFHEGIIAPIDGEGVSVNKDTMDEGAYKNLVYIVMKYYREERQ